jgi:tryptophan-rich hypothetical protein
MPRQLNPKKLLLSKWTAVQPQNKEKHFLIVQIANDTTPLIDKDIVVLEAVMTKKQYRIDWHSLLDETVWQQGWC